MDGVAYDFRVGKFLEMERPWGTTGGSKLNPTMPESSTSSMLEGIGGMKVFVTALHGGGVGEDCSSSSTSCILLLCVSLMVISN
jgi:hypothetical protein